MDYYKDEYSIRTKNVNGEEKYYLQFLGSVEASPEMEVDYDTYTLYAKEFSKPLKSQKYFKTTYDSKNSIDDVIDTNDAALHVASAEQEYLKKLKSDEIMTIIRTCTPTQQRRFNMRLNGLNNSQIAVIENVDESSIRESLKSISKKVKYFLK